MNYSTTTIEKMIILLFLFMQSNLSQFHILGRELLRTAKPVIL